MIFSSFLIQGWKNIRFPHPKSTKTTVHVHFPRQKSWLLWFCFMVQALNLILLYFLHFFTGDKTFCHWWQNLLPLVAKYFLTSEKSHKSMVLWHEDHALMAEGPCSYSEFHQWNTPKGPVLIRRRASPYSQKGLSFRVDHHGDPPNTPWGICQPSIVSRTTLYSVLRNPL